jgi:hypothetical protein
VYVRQPQSFFIQNQSPERKSLLVFCRGLRCGVSARTIGAGYWTSQRCGSARENKMLISGCRVVSKLANWINQTAGSARQQLHVHGIAPMRRPWVPFVTVLALAGCALLAACGSSNSNNNPGSPVVSTTTLPGATVNVAYTASLSATGGTAPYTWSVTTGSLPAGLTLSGSTISGTPTAAGTSMFTVQVTDAASRTGTAALSIKVSQQSPALGITTTSLPGGYVGVPYSATLGATGGVPPYTWSISPGTLPAGLTLAESTGVISGTPTASGSSSFTADVTDSQSNMASAQLQITINPALSNSALSGNYAFSLSGYQTLSGQQVPFFMAGSFFADGAGNLQGGVLDMNSSSGQQVDVSFTGMYSVSGNGIATMTFVTSTTTYSLSAIVSSGGNGQLILNNADPAPRGSGTFFLQNTQDFQVPPAASYAIGTLGADSLLNRYAAAGQFVVGSGGVLTSSTEDVNDNGMLTSRTFTGAFGAPNASTGRGTVGFTFNGVLNSYAYYVISSGQYILVGIDPLADNDPLTITSMLTQTGTYSNASLTGNSILELTGLTSNNADVVLGLATWDGNGNGTFSLDENAGGTITTQQMSQGTYTVESDGRVAVMSSSGSTIYILYLSNTNQAFVLGQDASVKAGVLEPQTAVPPYSNSSIFGTYLGGTVNPAQSPIVDASGYFLADGNGNLSGMESTSGPSGPGTLSLSAMYQVDSTGRAVLTGTPAGFMYVVSPKKVVLLPMGNAPALSVFNIGLTN